MLDLHPAKRKPGARTTLVFWGLLAPRQALPASENDVVKGTAETPNLHDLGEKRAHAFSGKSHGGQRGNQVNSRARAKLLRGAARSCPRGGLRPAWLGGQVTALGTQGRSSPTLTHVCLWQVLPKCSPRDAANGGGRLSTGER